MAPAFDRLLAAVRAEHFADAPKRNDARGVRIDRFMVLLRGDRARDPQSRLDQLETRLDVAKKCTVGISCGSTCIPKNKGCGTKTTAEKTAQLASLINRATSLEANAAKTAQKAKPVTKSKAKKPTDEEKMQAFEKLISAKSDQDKAAFRISKADGVSIPIAWTEVVYHGRNADIIAEGRDSKGRKQRAERPDYRQGLSNKNNARIAKTLTPKMDSMRKRLRKDAMAGNEEAKVLYLIAMTGFRIGGKGDGKAETEAFGASTLRGEHVKIEGDTVTFDFPGKKGIRQQHVLKDSMVASWFAGVKPQENLFATRDAKVREVWQEKYGGVKVHDIRHVVASELAKTNLAKLIPPKPKTKKESDALKSEVGTIVGKMLGNNPSQAIGTYIDPSLWKLLKVA
jgi:DNA topoisomerase-1